MNEIPKPRNQPRGVLRVSTIELILSVTDAKVYSPSSTADGESPIADCEPPPRPCCSDPALAIVYPHPLSSRCGLACAIVYPLPSILKMSGFGLRSFAR